MLLIVVILLVAYIIIPAVQIGIAERFRTPVQLIIYILTALYILFVLITQRGLM